MLLRILAAPHVLEHAYTNTSGCAGVAQMDGPPPQFESYRHTEQPHGREDL